jgi:hypothetical protein
MIRAAGLLDARIYSENASLTINGVGDGLPVNARLGARARHLPTHAHEGCRWRGRAPSRPC